MSQVHGDRVFTQMQVHRIHIACLSGKRVVVPVAVLEQHKIPPRAVALPVGQRFFQVYDLPIRDRVDIRAGVVRKIKSAMLNGLAVDGRLFRPQVKLIDFAAGQADRALRQVGSQGGSDKVPPDRRPGKQRKHQDEEFFCFLFFHFCPPEEIGYGKRMISNPGSGPRASSLPSTRERAQTPSAWRS